MLFSIVSSIDTFISKWLLRLSSIYFSSSNLKLLILGILNSENNLFNGEIKDIGFFDFEQEKVRRMTDMFTDNQSWVEKQRKDFVLFIDEYDKRRGKNFQETFPEMEDFYDLCKGT